MATPDLTAISVKAKVGITDVTKNVSAISEKTIAVPPFIPNIFRAK